jgi:hypothetical protein
MVFIGETFIIEYPSEANVEDIIGQYVKDNIDKFDDYFRELNYVVEDVYDTIKDEAIDHEKYRSFYKKLLERSDELMEKDERDEYIFNIPNLKKMLLASSNPEIIDFIFHQYTSDSTVYNANWKIVPRTNRNF